MTQINISGLEATLTAHTTFLIALASSHPDRPRLKYVFENLMSRLIASTEDPIAGGVLQTFEETIREALDGPGISAPPK